MRPPASHLKASCHCHHRHHNQHHHDVIGVSYAPGARCVHHTVKQSYEVSTMLILPTRKQRLRKGKQLAQVHTAYTSGNLRDGWEGREKLLPRASRASQWSIHKGSEDCPVWTGPDLCSRISWCWNSPLGQELSKDIQTIREGERDWSFAGARHQPFFYLRDEFNF